MSGRRSVLASLASAGARAPASVTPFVHASSPPFARASRRRVRSPLAPRPPPGPPGGGRGGERPPPWALRRGGFLGRIDALCAGTRRRHAQGTGEAAATYASGGGHARRRAWMCFSIGRANMSIEELLAPWAHRHPSRTTTTVHCTKQRIRCIHPQEHNPVRQLKRREVAARAKEPISLLRLRTFFPSLLYQRRRRGRTVPLLLTRQRMAMTAPKNRTSRSGRIFPSTRRRG